MSTLPEQASFSRLRNAEALVQARSMIGAPFLHQGRDVRVGVDCVGQLYCIGRAMGLDLEEIRDYPRLLPDSELLLRTVARYCDRVEEVSRGRVLLFWVGRMGDPQHVGIASERGFIHADTSLGIVEHPWTQAWQRRLHSVWEYRWSQ